MPNEIDPAGELGTNATLSGNSGRNDSNGVWGGLLNAVTGLGNTAANLATSFRTQRSATASLPTTTTTSTNYTPWLIGGGIVAALVVLVVMFRK